MTEVAIYKIGFACIDELAAPLQDIQNVVIGGNTPFLGHMIGFFDQKEAFLSERHSSDESGHLFVASLSFTVRTDADISLLKKYLRRRVAMYVWLVSGERYRIGSEDYPAYMEAENTYDGIRTRELSVKVEYETAFGILL